MVDGNEKSFHDVSMQEATIKKAVFLDRDGVINRDVHHLSKVADLRLLKGSARAIKALNDGNYRVIVVSNQAVIAKGMATHETVYEIHEELKRRLAKQGATIDAIYFCPHHTEGTVKEYAVACDCRKPAIGMVMQAMKDFDIDPRASFFVGDMTGDIMTGRRAGLRTILVKTGYGGKDARYDVAPDFVAKDLLSAAHSILNL